MTQQKAMTSHIFQHVDCRRRTPPCSPQPNPGSLSGAVHVSDDEHHLRPAGPATSDCLPGEPQFSPRGNCLHEPAGQATTRRAFFQQTGDCTGRDQQEVEVLNCISPESGQDGGIPLQPAGESPDGKASQRAQHDKAASDRRRLEPGHGLGSVAEEEEGTLPRAGEQAVHVRQQAAATAEEDCRSNLTAGVCDLEVPRPRQVSRRGRGRATQGAPCYRTPGMPVTLDSGRFGFVKWPSLRYSDLTFPYVPLPMGRCSEFVHAPLPLSTMQCNTS